MIMELFCVFWAKMRSLKGKPMFMDCTGVFNFITEGEESMYVFLGALLMIYGAIMNCAKKMLSLMSLTASIVSNDSFGVKNCIYWTC